MVLMVLEPYLVHRLGSPIGNPAGRAMIEFDFRRENDFEIDETRLETGDWLTSLLTFREPDFDPTNEWLFLSTLPVILPVITSWDE